MEVLQRKSDSMKRRVLEFNKFIDGKIQHFIESNSLDRQIAINIEARLEQILPCLDEFYSINAEIDTSSDNDNSTFETDYFDGISKARKLLEDINSTSHGNTGSSVSNSGASGAANASPSVKLPTIQLPKFRGDYTKWLEYRDTYEALIHENSSISDIQKFYYLKSSLEGDAAKIIQSVETSGAAYEAAWKRVCERFENRKILMQNHIRELFQLEAIQKESAFYLRKFLDTLNYHLHALKSLGLPVDQWDAIIVYIVTTRFDPITERDWKKETNKIDVPSVEELRSFLKGRAEMLENLNIVKAQSEKIHRGFKENVKHRPHAMFSNLSCYFCKGKHTIYNCNDFIKLDVKRRTAEIKRLKFCNNCLRPGHQSASCESTGCKRCHRRHNTLLHTDKDEEPQEQLAVDKVDNAPGGSVCYHLKGPDYALLGTAKVIVFDKNNQNIECRVLLDCGSQSNFVTQSFQDKLGLRVDHEPREVSGVNSTTTHIAGKSIIKLKSLCTDFESFVDCLIVPTISANLPQVRINSKNWPIHPNLKLADPTFSIPGPIDMLLGVSLYSKLLLNKQIDLGHKMPTLQKSKLGWIIGGPVPMKSIGLNRLQCNFSNTLIQDQLCKFWELEEVAKTKAWSSDEKACEEHFVSNFKTNANGRFNVSIPFKEDIRLLGDSRTGALKRFYSLERKLEENPLLKTQYVTFMREYEELGHMTQVDNVREDKEYFLPHHGVVNNFSTTTRLRVVFDGSFRSDSGHSRNDLEFVGRVIQSDLFAILLRFRQHAIAVSADIEKMYRQVEVNDSDRCFQKIFWREQRSDNVRVFVLNTVTYGTAAASFLAIRCLHQVAENSKTKFPIASNIIKSDFYVDDLLTGADTVQEAITISTQISNILKTGCFPLRKWLSSNKQVLEGINATLQEPETINFTRDSHKTLGLHWSPQSDNLLFKTSNYGNTGKSMTKRSILSTISQIFDPLGLLAPCVIKPKILMQRIWQSGFQWDDLISKQLQLEWLSFKTNLYHLDTLQIRRYAVCSNAVHIQLHGFADASEKAYGACVYLRSVDTHGFVSIQLLCSKSKVAPLKTLTIPRLELCAALILARLVNVVLTSLRLTIDEVYLWSDSTIVLSWLQTPETSMKIFVANRVSEIGELIGNGMWRHVPSECNPADLISRGVCPSEIATQTLWWHGPVWLSKSCKNWPLAFSKLASCDLPELRAPRLEALATINLSSNIQFDRFSSFARLLRAIGYCLRFLNNCKRSTFKWKGDLSGQELNSALEVLIHEVQASEFSTDIFDLKTKGQVSRKSAILSLNPFIDSSGILRVGGRLRNAMVEYDAKFPILLPSKHRFTYLYFLHEHQRLGHAGPQQLLASIRNRFWPIRGRTLAKRILHSCIRCYRVKPVNVTPIMGNLPASRVNPTFPFQETGVDYAGPFTIRDRKGRGFKTRKCYLALFICLSCKAVHLEVVSDLTTQAFIATLKRFISRRGIPKFIWSDNGTNFVGAARELKRQFCKLEKEEEITAFAASESVEWKFIVPHAPHFGGLWEAAVKRAKFHLKRIVGEASLTFEELTTVFCQIESILNSRPLLPLTNDPTDLEALTPSHFLIGRMLTALPDPNFTSTPVNKLNNFQRIQQLVQHFWRRWQQEYLPSLQPRNKWKMSQSPINKGQLALIRDENLPPLCWLLGRVQELHPGADGVVRAVTMRTARGSLKRPVAKIYPLPTI